MKFVKLALVFFFAITLTGCDQLNLLGGDPTVTLAPTHPVTPGEPTRTKWVFHTSTPEYVVTPKPVIPTYEPVDGWQKIEGDDYEIYLPDSYEGGNTGENIEQIIENLRILGGAYNAVADNLANDPDAYELIATDTKKGPSGYITNIGITTEVALPAYSIEAAMSTETAGLPDNFTIVSEKITVINGYDAGQIIIEANINNMPVKELIYIIKGENSVWKIGFATGADEYDNRTLEFVQIVDSFRIK